MEAIYRDAYPDIFSTFDDFESLRAGYEKPDKEEKTDVDRDESESMRTSGR